MKTRITIERDPEECCATYFDTAKQIAKIEHPVGSPEWHDLAIRMIKRHGHHQKLSVYSRMKFWFADSRDQKHSLENVELKIQTHSKLAQCPLSEVM